jgi:hypothetical protein
MEDIDNNLKSNVHILFHFPSIAHIDLASQSKFFDKKNN